MYGKVVRTTNDGEDMTDFEALYEEACGDVDHYRGLAEKYYDELADLKRAAMSVEDQDVLKHVREEVHHNLNPLIEMVRWRCKAQLDDETLDPDTFKWEDAPVGPEITLTFRDAVWLVKNMRIATDACDAALGEESWRDQIAKMKKELGHT